jgi:hypothetical protein
MPDARESAAIDRLLTLMNRARALRHHATTASLRAWAMNSLNVLYAAARMLDGSPARAAHVPLRSTLDVVLEMEEEFLDRLEELVVGAGGTASARPD